MLLFSCCHVELYATPWTAAFQASCSSLSPRVCPNSCLFSHWCHPTISFSVALFSSALNLSQHQGFFFFPNESAFHITWPKYWSFSISPSNEYSGLISFRDWLVWSPSCPRDSQESSPASVWKHQLFGAQPSLWVVAWSQAHVLESEEDLNPSPADVEVCF